MSDPTGLSPVKSLSRPVPAVVDLVRKLLEMAEAGDLTSVSVATVCAGRNTGSGFALGPSDCIADLYLAHGRMMRRLEDHRGDG